MSQAFENRIYRTKFDPVSFCKITTSRPVSTHARCEGTDYVVKLKTWKTSVAISQQWL